MANRDENWVDGSFAIPYCSTPGLTTIPYQETDISSFFNLLFTLSFYLLLAKTVDVEQRLSCSNGRNVEKYPQMAGKSALVLMEDSVSVNDKKLRPELRLFVLELLEEMP